MGRTPAVGGAAGARPARPSDSARRRAILDAASSLFVEYGFHPAGMDEIADHAGVSKPVLYQHFPSKRALHLEVLRSHVDAFLDGVREALRSTTDNRRRVADAVGAVFAFADANTTGFRLVFGSGPTVDDDVRRELSRALDGCVEAVHDLVRGDSGLDEHRSRLLAVGLVGASREAAGSWLDAGRPLPWAEAVETTATLIWGGLSRVPLHPASTDG